MFSFFCATLLIGYVFGVDDDCSATTSICGESDYRCTQLYNQITYPTGFDTTTFTISTGDVDNTKYQCESSDFCSLFDSSDSECNYVTFDYPVPYCDTDPDGDSLTDDCTCYDSDDLFGLQPTISVSSTMDCCALDDCTTEFASTQVTAADDTCVENTDIAEAMEGLLTCLAPQDVLEYIQCYPDSFTSECPDYLEEHLEGYEDCACAVLNEAFDAAGYEAGYFQDFSDLVQENLASVFNYFEYCDADYLSLDCECYIDDCTLNDCCTLTDCDETDDEETDQDGSSGVLVAELQINICYNQKRSEIWKYIKQGFDIEIAKYDADGNGVAITMDSYVRSYGYNTKDHGKDKTDKCTLEADVELTAAIYYEDYDVLEAVYDYLIGLGSVLQEDLAEDILGVSIEGDTVYIQGFGAVELETFSLALYDAAGELVEGVFVDPDSTGDPVTQLSGAMHYSFGAIFALLFAVIMCQ
eukprot:246088_1